SVAGRMVAGQRQGPRINVDPRAFSRVRVVVRPSGAGPRAHPRPGRTVLSVLDRATALGPVVHLALLDAVEPARAQPVRVADLGDVGQVVGDGVEDQIDLQAGQVGADAEVGAGA